MRTKILIIVDGITAPALKTGSKAGCSTRELSHVDKHTQIPITTVVEITTLNRNLVIIHVLLSPLHHFYCFHSFFKKKYIFFLQFSAPLLSEIGVCVPTHKGHLSKEGKYMLFGSCIMIFLLISLMTSVSIILFHSMNNSFAQRSKYKSPA